MANLLYLKVPNGETGVAEFTNLDDYYKVLETECFDIVNLKIGEKYFNCYVDDNGRLKKDAIPSAINKDTAEILLVGNIIFSNADDEGEAASLSDEDIQLIRDNIIKATAFINHDFITVHCVQVAF